VTAAVHLRENLPPVHGDRVQLQQVLLNLVMNACDAMSATECTRRRLTIRSDVDHTGMPAVSVADCGAGVVEADREKLFEPFFTTKRNGLGLGLPISRSIIAAHGGRLWAQNNAEGGATFYFALPAHP
jgi:two-component system sensor kinase FixL